MDDNKEKALAAALGQIERQFGKGSVMRTFCLLGRNSLQCYGLSHVGHPCHL